MVKKKTEKIGEGLGITGFILGILSILLAGFLGIFLAVIGFVFCMIQQKKSPTKLAKVGIILTIIGFILSIALLVVIVPYIQQQLQNLPTF